MTEEIQKKIKFLETEIFSRNEKRYWKAAADLNEFSKDSPGLIWNIVVKAGSGDDSELRQAVSLCVLEHLLANHFDEYFPKVEEIIRSGNLNFRLTLKHCSKMKHNQSEENSLRWDNLMRETDPKLKNE